VLSMLIISSNENKNLEVKVQASSKVSKDTQEKYYLYYHYLCKVY